MDAVISSRTPEGEPFHCRYCGASDFIEPSTSTGDAPCPCCGHLLWFFGRPSRRRTPWMLRDHVHQTLLQGKPHRRMFGVVATVARQVRRVFEARQRREPRPAQASNSGVYDHWLDG